MMTCSRMLSLVLILFLGLPAGLSAQSEPEVATARLLWLDGKYDAALLTLEPAAESGNRVAQNILGVSYQNGNGVELDLNTAVIWYGRAADQGFDKAHYNLGILLRDGGPGLPVDYQSAKAHLSQAIELDYAAAFSALGVMIQNGQGGEVDYSAAVALYERGNLLQDLYSMNNLATMLRQGLGIEQDEVRARELYQEAADQGLALAQNNYAVMLEIGIGGEVSEAEALRYYQMSMAQGYVQGAQNAALLLSNPQSAVYDVVPGLAHCLWALERSDKENRAQIRGDCEAIGLEMSEAQIVEASALASRL